MNKKILAISVISCYAAWSFSPASAQQAIVKEQETMMKTYPFSDPDPVAQPAHLYYPYFRFDCGRRRGEGVEKRGHGE